MSEGETIYEKYKCTWLVVLVDFYHIFLKKYNVPAGYVHIQPINDLIFLIRFSSTATDAELTFIVSDKNKILHYVLKEDDQIISKGSVTNTDLEPLLIELHKTEIEFAETKNPA